MAKLRLSDAPGCIGSPIIRSEKHPICSNCVFTKICASLALRNAERLKKELGVEELSRQTGKKLIKGAEKLTIAQLESPAFKGKKPLTESGRKLQSSLLKGGSATDIVAAMKLPTKTHVEQALQFTEPDWARQCLVLIWENGGQIKRRDLGEYMEHELGYPRMSARSLTSNFINAVTNLDIFVEDKSKLRVIDEASG